MTITRELVKCKDSGAQLLDSTSLPAPTPSTNEMIRAS